MVEWHSSHSSGKMTIASLSMDKHLIRLWDHLYKSPSVVMTFAQHRQTRRHSVPSLHSTSTMFPIACWWCNSMEQFFSVFAHSQLRSRLFYYVVMCVNCGLWLCCALLLLVTLSELVRVVRQQVECNNNQGLLTPLRLYVTGICSVRSFSPHYGKKVIHYLWSPTSHATS